MKVISIMVISVLLYACSGANHKEDKFIVSLQQTLDQSSDLVNSQTQMQFELLKAKQHDPITSDRATRWLPLAEKTKESTSNLVNYINNLQDQIQKQENYKASAANTFFRVKSRVNTLNENISTYRNMIASLGEEINKIFKKEIHQVDVHAQNETNDENMLLMQKTNEMALVALSSFKSKLKVVENSILTYCNSMASPGCILRFDKFEALVSQNTKILRAGDELVISAGVASFSNASKPVFNINGKEVPSEWGEGKYKIHVKEDPGDYSIPVNISYTKPDGTKDEHVFTVHYTIFNENKN